MNIFVLVFLLPVFVLAIIILYCTVRSYRFKRYVARTASQLGYRVYEHPYCFLGSRMYTEFKVQEKLHNDSHFHYKN